MSLSNSSLLRIEHYCHKARSIPFAGDGMCGRMPPHVSQGFDFVLQGASIVPTTSVQTGSDWGWARGRVFAYSGFGRTGESFPLEVLFEH